ncbi:MAG: DUF1800 domain-containing protein [Alphaproteobacteria bacterium]
MKFKLSNVAKINLFLLLFSLLFCFKVLAKDNLNWYGDSNSISNNDWDLSKAKHLLERAGFGGTPEQVELLFNLGLSKAVEHLVHYENISIDNMPEFDESDIHDPGLINFPPSRPATTKLAKETGEALGIKVKESGNRKLQPIVNKFFFWLRASRLETKRVAYWWADRMINSPRPLEEKMTLFWHNHFANNETKVRDYRKLLLQNKTFRLHATGNFKNLIIAAAKDPAMLYFLDAGQNVKGSPNENFAREIMELFTLGVGNYEEIDIREAARAFTGWNTNDLEFVVNTNQHDADIKTILNKTGNFSGEDVIDILLTQDAASRFIVTKIYKEFVNDNVNNDIIEDYARILKSNNYELKPLLSAIFLSKDFYSQQNIGSHIKSPVELVISTYRKLGLNNTPGVPDFNQSTTAMGQTLFWPPTVAGWAGGRSWITPALLMERGNFARSFLYPDIDFIDKDFYSPDPKIIVMHKAIREGADITSATKSSNGGESMMMMSEANMMADRDEDFNTRYGSYRGWQMAVSKVKPIVRDTININFSKMILDSGAKNTSEAIDYLINRFLVVKLNEKKREMIISFLNNNLGTENIIEAKSYLEDSLKMALHLIMSQPEYQLG